MSTTSPKSIERSVDSVARIYAIVIGLALSEAVRTLITKNEQGNPDLSIEKIRASGPAFVAFVVTLVPFWHGMNRHLDRCYIDKNGLVAQGALLFDFGIFFIEASLLLIAGWSLRAELNTFHFLGAVLVIDMAWGYISHWIHFPGQKSYVVRWAAINGIFILLSAGVVSYRFENKAVVLMILAIARSVVDYWACWKFYFPGASAEIDTSRPQI